jgi:Transposase DDE domain
MLKTKPNAFGVVEATLGKINKVSRPAQKFILHIVELWLGMNCRYRFSNMARWGSMAEKTYRNWFKKCFDWLGFSKELAGQYFGREVIAVFDPSYIKKSGRETYGIGKFWSGTSQKVLKGLEIGCLAFIDVAAGTALHALAVQTPSPGSLKQEGKTLVHHYVNVIADCMAEIVEHTVYLVVDGYFMKKEFIQPLLGAGLHVITKGRHDINLQYLYRKPQRKGRGRKKLYDGKVNTGAIDKRRLRCVYKDDKMLVHAGLVYCVLLKQIVLAAFVYYPYREKPEIIIGTDVEMTAATLCRYYGLRFQVEFLIRDAKQFAGLEDCMARDETKLHNHFNLSLTAVSVAKAAYHLSLPEEERGSFSMADVKMLYMNQLLTTRIFSNLGLDLSCRKIKRLFNQCLNFGRVYPDQAGIRA